MKRATLALFLTTCSQPVGPGGAVDGVPPPSPCAPPCGERQACSAGACVDLPARCPCPAGSFCDLAADQCRPGCLDDAACAVAAGEVCDPAARACVCKAPLHRCGRACVPEGPGACGAACAVCPAVAHGTGTCEGGACSLACDRYYHLEGSACVPAPVDCYADADGDGYGDPTRKSTVLGVACPAGSIDRAGDCDDGSTEAHPGQKRYFTSGHGPLKSFDYDCDGKVTEAPLLATGDGPSKCQANPPPDNAMLSSIFCLDLMDPACDCSVSPSGIGSPVCGERRSGKLCYSSAPADKICRAGGSVTFTVACR